MIKNLPVILTIIILLSSHKALTAETQLDSTLQWDTLVYDSSLLWKPRRTRARSIPDIYKRSYLKVGFNQYYFSKELDYTKYYGGELQKQHGYTGLGEIAGVLYIPNELRPLTFFTGVSTGLVVGNIEMRSDSSCFVNVYEVSCGILFPSGLEEKHATTSHHLCPIETFD